jgi:DNA gyrase subunit A
LHGLAAHLNGQLVCALPRGSGQSQLSGGRVYGQRVFALPDAARDGRGLPIVNFLNLVADERVTTLLVVPDFSQAEYVTLVTRLGRIKRLKLSEFAAVRPSGIIAINLEPGDELGWARATSGGQQFLIVTAHGRALRFPEASVRAQGRTAAGVAGVRLISDDEVAGFDVVEPEGELLVLTQRGWGKRTPLDEYRLTGRNAQGVWALARDKLELTGNVVAARVVQPGDHVTIITSNGLALRTPVATISLMGRATRGVRIVNAGDSDTVRAMARMLADLAVGDEPETTIAVPVPVRQVVEPEPAPSEALAGVAGDGPAV